ncbi:MAG: peptidoglycan-binding protein [Lachnospiraceae bacterium]|nr:peptidoglycan-binding protein [Lachnospiraceae bacterium]
MNKKRTMKSLTLRVATSLCAGVIAFSSVAALPLPNGSEHSMISIAEAAVTYNSGAAVSYARRYSCSDSGTCGCSYDPRHINYNSSGGDCANFVSSALVAGGLPTDSTWGTYNSGGKIAGTSTYINADLLLYYFRDHSAYKNLVRMSPSASEIKPGNPVWTSLGHVMICTGISSSGTPLLSGHNNDRLDLEVSRGYYATVRLDLLASQGSGSSNSGSNGQTLSRNLSRNSQGSDVKMIQEYLGKLGYNIGSCGVDGIFGRDTENAVKQFQKNNNLECDGIVGPLTFSKLVSKVNELSKASSSGNNTSSNKNTSGGLSRLISYGCTGDDVKEIQSLLTEKGYTVKIDGIFGDETRKAVLKYQKDHSLEVDGIVGDETYRSLSAIVVTAVAVPAFNADDYPTRDVEPLIYGNAQSIMSITPSSVDTAILIAPAPKIDSVFNDVKTGVYYYDAVQWAYFKGITGGVKDKDGTGLVFNPQATCNRAQMVSFLWRMAGCPDPTITKNPFKDAKDTKAYYYKAMLWGYETGIVGGYKVPGGYEFRPDNVCTRAQAVSFLWRMAGKPEPSGSKNAFSDNRNKDSYYYQAVLWASESGITGGYSDGTFRPENQCSRSQMVTFLYRYKN